MKKDKKSGHDTDIMAPARACSVNLSKNKKLQTEKPITKKDEVRQAEARQRKQAKIIPF